LLNQIITFAQPLWSANYLIWHSFISILIEPLNSRWQSVKHDTWHLSIDRSVSIRCRRFERYPVVIVSFVARLETVHAIFRHARSVYLSKSLDRLGWIARRNWRVGRLTYSVIVWPIERSVRWTGFCENAHCNR